MEWKNSTHLSKELLQIMKKLIDLGKKQDKRTHILYLNIWFYNLLLILPLLLVNQRVIFHILLEKTLEKLETLWADATDSIPQNHICTVLQLYQLYLNY